MIAKNGMSVSFGPNTIGLAGSGHGEYGEIAVIAGGIDPCKVVSFVKLICGTFVWLSLSVRTLFFFY